MISKFIAVAMDRAHYELLESNEGFFGFIPELQGVWASKSTLEACRESLKSALEDRLLFSIFKHHSIPVLDGIDLAVPEMA